MVGSSWGSGVITKNLSRFRSRSYPPFPYPELTLVRQYDPASDEARAKVLGFEPLDESGYLCQREL